MTWQEEKHSRDNEGKFAFKTEKIARQKKPKQKFYMEIRKV